MYSKILFTDEKKQKMDKVFVIEKFFCCQFDEKKVLIFHRKLKLKLREVKFFDGGKKFCESFADF